MQYPQIQFYRGSLVRLASGKLKQVEDLSSDDFIESAQLSTANKSLSNIGHPSQRLSFDENNNSVFNSPEPAQSFHSDLMETEHEMEDEEQDEEDEELDVVSDHHLDQFQPATKPAGQQQIQPAEPDNLHIDSGVVKDFLEVGPPGPTSPPNADSRASTSSSPGSPPVNLTVLIKFFLESSRTVVFIEVPIEHPFFVFHRGWSSCNPQRTYDKFGLKCRKLKIGDTCISLIRRQRKPHSSQQQQQESDQCNILFSSIKINE